MIIEATGVVWNVAGRSNDMAATGPIPGRTPTIVPMRTPTKQYRIFSGSKATKNPVISKLNGSKIYSLF